MSCVYNIETLNIFNVSRSAPSTSIASASLYVRFLLFFFFKEKEGQVKINVCGNELSIALNRNLSSMTNKTITV